MLTRDILLSALKTSGPMCDDCLSSSAFVKPRQTVNVRCRELKEEGILIRQKDQCPQCKASKIVNRLLANHETPSKPVDSVPQRDTLVFNNDKPWYWEGNVQNRIVEYLESAGWIILSSADTATREAGKDIVATKNGKELWVSVKGWPEKSQNTQARHWFSSAIFDLVLYKDQNPNVYLAIGIPAGYSTYQNLMGRVLWIRKNLPFEIITVPEEGIVEIQENPNIKNV